MFSFDQTYAYQFSLFFAENPEFAPSRVEKLAGILNADVDGVKLKGPRFKAPESEQAFVVQAGTATTTTALTWKSGVWRMVFTPVRLDLHFDALGHADVMEAPPLSVADIRTRIGPNLSHVPAALDQKPNRLALIVTAKAGADLAKSTAVVARMFLRPDLEGQGGELHDVIVRTNRAARWTLGGVDTNVNRNETASSVWALRNGVEETTLSWQLDVNTSPVPTTGAEFGSEGITQFFARAEEWIDARLNAIGAAK